MISNINFNYNQSAALNYNSNARPAWQAPCVNQHAQGRRIAPQTNFVLLSLMNRLMQDIGRLRGLGQGEKCCCECPTKAKAQVKATATAKATVTATATATATAAPAKAAPAKKKAKSIDPDENNPWKAGVDGRNGHDHSDGETGADSDGSNATDADNGN